MQTPLLSVTILSSFFGGAWGGGGGGGSSLFVVVFFFSFFLGFVLFLLLTLLGRFISFLFPFFFFLMCVLLFVLSFGGNGADIAGQALDIFLHGPESTHKNGIGKTFTHTSIPIHPCTLPKQSSPSMTPSFSSPLLSNMVVVDGQEAWQMLLRTAPPSEAFSPRTVLTENR